MYVGNILYDGWNSNDKEMVLILLAANTKAGTSKWSPIIDEWTEILFKLYTGRRRQQVVLTIRWS